ATLPEENYGLFEISDAAAGLEGSADEESIHQVDIVAVHGLMGHWANTWNAGNSHDDAMFLRDRIPADLSRIGVRARVFSYGYDSAVVFSKSVATIDQAASVLLERLYGNRKKSEEKARPIIFIAHSLGGLRYNELLDSFKGCLFLGVPHGGADSAYWAKFPARMVPYVTFGLRGNPSFLKSLESKSADCVRISRDFVHRAVLLKIRTFYETEKLGNMIVVDRSSATLNLPNEVAVALDGSNHVTICKFSASDKERYEPVKDAIEELVIAGLGTTQKPPIMPLKNDMPSSTGTFCGREKELQKMAGALRPAKPRQTDDTDPTHPRPNGLVLYGIGGSGKTQLALRYIQEHGSLYKAIVWINASDTQNLEASFAEAANLLSGWPDNTAPRSSTAIPQKLVVAKLRDPRSSPWLLVMDSVDDLNQHDFRACIPDCAHGSVLVTSTRANASAVFRLPSLEIDDLDESSGCQLLLKIVGDVAIPETDWAAKIAKELHGIPLAIEHAGELIRTSLSPEQFLKSYRESYLWLMTEYPERGILSYDKNRSIIVVFDLLFQHIKNKYPQAGALLIFLAILGTWKISTTFLNQYQHFLSEIQSADDEESQHLVQALGSPEALQITLSCLANVCLVRRDSLQGHLYKSITLHKAIRDWSLRTSLQGKQAWLLQAARGLVTATLSHDNQIHSLNSLQQAHTLDRVFLAPLRQCVALLRNSIPADEILPPHGKYCRQYAELVVDLSQVDLSCGLLAEAERDFTDAIEYQRAKAKKEWPYSRADLMLLQGLAVVRSRLGDFDSCIEVLKTALDLAEILYEPFDPEPVAIVSYMKEVSETHERLQQDHKNVVLARSNTITANVKAFGKGSWDETFIPSNYAEQHTVPDKNHVEEDIDFDADLRGAACRGYIEEVKLLLSIEGINPNSQDEHEMTALSWAVYKRHEGIVQLLLGIDQINVNVKDPKGRTPLHVYSSAGNSKIVQMLLQRGADINETGDLGNALQTASTEGHDKIVHMLLKSGADVNNQNGERGSPLQIACEQGYTRIVQMLLEHNADVNSQSESYGSLLYIAVRGGYSKIVQMLLEHNAGVNPRGRHRHSALELASEFGHVEIVQMLLKRDADVNAQGEYLGSALVTASRRGYDKIVQILLDSAARLTNLEVLFDQFNNDCASTKSRLSAGIWTNANSVRERVYDQPLLHWAAEHGHQPLTDHCIDLGAEVDATDIFGETALHSAARNGHLEIVKKLVQANADKTIRNDDGRTALQCAQQAGRGGEKSYPAIVAYLRGPRRTLGSIYNQISSFRRA
ncbi:hypothetical protein KCU65_g4796, partial [Aureobasidium melanogenum]